jgi:hypothetical protein
MAIIYKPRDEQKLLEQLCEALRELPAVAQATLHHAEPAAGSPGNARADGVIRLRITDNEFELLPYVRSLAYPSALRSIAWELGHSSQDEIPIIVAPAISPGAKKMLRDQGIAYFDSGGSLYLPLRTGMFYLDRPLPKAGARHVRSLFSGRRGQVLVALLSENAQWWSIGQMAKRAGVSPYLAHQVFVELEKELWVESKGHGPRITRKLTNPGALLDAWTEHHTLKIYQFRNYYAWSQSIDALRESLSSTLADAGIEYAFTMAAGAQLVAPYLSSVDKLHVILHRGADITPAVDHLSLRPVDEGASICFMETKYTAPFTARNRIGNCWVVSNPYLYLDLMKWPARGKEQAEHLRREVLKY